MPTYRLNRKSLERLKALVRAGDYVDRAWSFNVTDSNALLGDPANWAEYQQWFLGIGISVPDAAIEVGPSNEQQPRKEWYAYPFGKGDVVNLAALRSIVSAAGKAGENDIATAAEQVILTAEKKNADQATAVACNRDIHFAATGQLKAAAAAGAEGVRIPTFHAVCYTGVAMNLEGFNYPVVIDYDGMDFTLNARPALRDHDPKRPIGHTTSVAVVNGQLEADGEISVVSQDAQEVVDSGKQGFPWQISVGMKVIQSQFVPEGATAPANGKTWPGPLIIARQTLLSEISFLSLGADDNTSGRIAARAAKGKSQMKKKFAAWAKARGLTMADMEDDGVSSSAKALYKAQMKADPDDASDEDDDGKDEGVKEGKSGAVAPAIRAAAASAAANAGGTAIANLTADAVKELRAAATTERKRYNAITATLDQYRKEIKPDKFAVIEAKALDGEYDETRTELECIKARRPELHAASASFGINTGVGGAADANIIAAAAARSVGVSEKVAYHGLDERSGNIAASMRGLTLHKLIAISAQRMGMHVTAGGIDESFLHDFIRRDRESHRTQLSAAAAAGGGLINASSASGFSTMSLTGITENILYKSMLEAYGMQATVVPDIAYERDTNDFKPFKVYRLTAAGDFQPVGPAGEVKSMSLQDESYANQVKRNAVLLTLSSELIINDDMGALTQLSQVLGRKGALNREKIVILNWLAGLSTIAPGPSVGKAANSFNFFSNGAGNYLSGATSALSMTSLQLAEQKFLEQKDAGGDPVGLMPDRLLVAPANKVVADNLFQGANMTVQALDLPASNSGTSAAQTGKQTPNLNYFRGKYRPIVSPYLSSKFLGNDSQWGLLGNPAGGMATVQVGYLRGQRTPMIRQVETDASILGIAFQAVYDFGVALLDSRTGVYSVGQ